MASRFSTPMLVACVFSFAAATAQGATISEDFESPTTPPAIPTGWQAVSSGVTTAANGNPGNALNAASGGTNYLVNSGSGFDATQDISGSFDFYIVESGNYSNGAFFFGDVQSGLGSTAGDHLRIDLRERSFGARANILDANGTTLFDGSGDNTYRIDTDVWINASFTWTAATGDFSFSWTYPAQPNRGPMTVANYTLNSNEVFFGFGTVDDAARFDNIVINGELIPEPGSLALLSLGGVLLAARRRRD